MSDTDGLEPHDDEDRKDTDEGRDEGRSRSRDPEGTGTGSMQNVGSAPDAENVGGAEGAGGAAGDAPEQDAPVPAPRIPLPRVSVEDGGLPLPDPRVPAGPEPVRLEHPILKSLLGAWALAACSAEETDAVEMHLGDCGACADEARRLREAVGLLHRSESLDLDPALRTRVLDGCLERRPPRVPVPAWAASYDAETARLDALLQDFGDAEWHAPVRLRWFRGESATSRRTTVAGVIAHLLAVDGLIAVALGLDDPLDADADAGDATEQPDAEGRPKSRTRTPSQRTEAFWAGAHFPPSRSVRGPWREQTHALVRTVSFAGGGPAGLPVSYGGFELPLRDAMLDRAFECWVHAEDIAEAVDYPYAPPAPRHLHGMIDLAARMLPETLAARRRAGLASPARTRRLVTAGRPGRSLRLEIEGSGGGQWLIPLDSPARPVRSGPADPGGAMGPADDEVAHVAMDDVEFCRLAAGHVSPEEAAAGQVGDRDAIRDVLFAAAGLSRM
ncbi:immediate early protein [Streptomyces sp. P3]|uniref:maleylpyruvate isomerase N-terminal domain-containing protein n=1 Tax=Streptomyces sp. P3 TaxID=2135430 RepID=UPI000D20E322|nr:maleylpyruvate isomerase N-terminal domain-containing protein [Streptomyces sp. P3]AVV42054.1 immediate early protein [Streptomyces sp. P3]